METRGQSLILDCSIYIAAILPDEQSGFADEIFTRIEKDEIFPIVPPLFLLEVINILLVAKRRGRIDEDSYKLHISAFVGFPWGLSHKTTYDETFLADAVWLADKYNLSVYDAIYLALSRRKNIQLATLDKSLALAAKQENLLFSL